MSAPPEERSVVLSLSEYDRLKRAREMLQFIHDNCGRIALFGWSGDDVRRLAERGLS